MASDRGRGIRGARGQARQPRRRAPPPGHLTCSSALGLDLELPAPTRRRGARPRRASPSPSRRSSTPGSGTPGPTRRELGIPTVFNILGPLCNPARPEASAVGVANLDKVPLDRRGVPDPGRDGARLPRRRRPRRAHHHRPQPHLGGLQGRRHEHDLDPLELGIPRARSSDLLGGDAGAQRRQSPGECWRGSRGRFATSCCSTRPRDSSRSSSRRIPSRCSSRFLGRLARAVRACAPTVVDSGLAEQKLADWVAATNR